MRGCSSENRKRSLFDSSAQALSHPPPYACQDRRFTVWTRSFPREYVKIFQAEKDAAVCRSFAAVEWHSSDRVLGSFS